MFTFIDDILVINEGKDVGFFDPNRLLIFSKKSQISNRETVNKYKEYIKNFPNKKFKPSNPRESSHVNLELHVTENCNLRCKYCYIETNYIKTNLNMTESTIEKAFNFTNQNFPKTELINIFLFGGEPALFWKKFDYLLKTAKEKFLGKKIRFYFATNGTVLNKKIISFMKQKNVFFSLSMDGPKEIQDQLRITEKKLGSYELISKNLPFFQKINKSLAIRATITPYNINLTNLFEFFKKKGGQKIEFLLCSSKEFQIHKEKLQILKNELKKLANIYLKHIFKEDKIIKVNPFFKHLQKLHFQKKQRCRCKSGKNLFTVSIDEKIYSCHRFVGNKKFQIGNLDKGFYDPYQIRKKLLEFDVQKIKKCKNCFAKLVCGGKCLHEQFTLSSPVSCEITQLSFFLSIQIYFKLLKLPNSAKKFNQLFKKSKKT